MRRKKWTTRRTVAAAIGVEHVMVSTMELTDPRYADNTPPALLLLQDRALRQIARNRR